MLSMPRLGLVLALGLGTLDTPRAQTFEPTPSWTWDGIQNAGTGLAVALSDLDGNGFADVITSEPFYFTPCCPSVNQQGLAVAFYSSPTGPSTSIGWSRIGENSGTTLAFRIARAGDVNGDGFEEVVYSSGSGFGGGTHSFWLEYGSASGIDQGWVYDSGLLLGTLGGAVTSGDFNGDGFDDIAGGIRAWPSGFLSQGRVLVFFGAAAGLAAQPDQAWSGARDQELGAGVASTGDVDGDGFDDLLVTDRVGIARLYHGSTGGFDSTSPAWSYAIGASSSSLAGVGDVNRDGFADFVIAPFSTPHATGTGSVRLFLGGPQGPGTGPDQELFGRDLFGTGLAGGTDVNGDGFDDLVVGAPGNGTVPGSVRLFLGSTGGYVPAPAWQNGTFPETSTLGSSVALGYVDDDPHVDLLVGESGASWRVHVFRGQAGLTAGPAGAVAGSSADALRLTRGAGGAVRLSWGESCSPTEEDFAVYAGPLGAFADTDPAACSTAGKLGFELSDDDTDRFYLVVPQSDDREGSYGTDGAGMPRPSSANACQAQALAACATDGP